MDFAIYIYVYVCYLAVIYQIIYIVCTVYHPFLVGLNICAVFIKQTNHHVSPQNNHPCYLEDDPIQEVVSNYGDRFRPSTRAICSLPNGLFDLWLAYTWDDRGCCPAKWPFLTHRIHVWCVYLHGGLFFNGEFACDYTSQMDAIGF